MSDYPTFFYDELLEASQSWRYKPAIELLANKTILITGAGDGIGAVMAKTAACFGANVVLLGRTRSKLETVFDWIEAHTNTEPVIVECDLETIGMDQIDALAQNIEETYGVLNGLIHNASLLGPKVPIAHYPADEWQRVMQVNANAPFMLTKGLFNLLDASGDAVIIFVSSTVGREGRAYWGAYSASKFALEGLSQIIADETEVAANIKVYSVNPGGTRTRMRREAYPMENPEDVPPAEQHMDLFLALLGGEQPSFTPPQTGAQLDTRTWQP